MRACVCVCVSEREVVVRVGEGQGDHGIPPTPWLVTTCVMVIQWISGCCQNQPCSVCNCRVLRNQFVWPPGDMLSPPILCCGLYVRV